MRLLPLMQAKGVKLSPEEFQSAVNTTFHAFESEVYDEIHQGMWKSLYKQFDLLSGDVLGGAVAVPERMEAVDVGCGTGLGSELLLSTELGRRVSKVYLIDTSPKMLEKAAARAKRWGVAFELVEGMLDALPANRCDLVLACSVLHHIPNVARFLMQVQEIQPVGGLFVHVQDPNGQCREDQEYVARTQSLKAARAEFVRRSRRVTLGRVAGRIKRVLSVLTNEDYIQKVNRSLLSQGVIARAMTSHEIWQVTDLHVYDDGISMDMIAKSLSRYASLATRSYGFYGELWSDLPLQFRHMEAQLIEEHALNGREVSGAWAKLCDCTRDVG